MSPRSQHPAWNEPHIRRLRSELTVANERLGYERLNVRIVGLIDPPEPLLELAACRAAVERAQAMRDDAAARLAQALELATPGARHDHAAATGPPTTLGEAP